MILPGQVHRGGVKQRAARFLVSEGGGPVLAIKERHLLVAAPI